MSSFGFFGGFGSYPPRNNDTAKAINEDMVDSNDEDDSEEEQEENKVEEENQVVEEQFCVHKSLKILINEQHIVEVVLNNMKDYFDKFDQKLLHA